MTDRAALLDRAIKQIESAFDESVKGAAQQEWFKLSGKISTIPQLSPSFKEALAQIEQLREQQLADAKAHFGNPP